ncbi:MAG: PPC domain-containing protein [Anaerolineae bacterium]|nr:PPC domain-containing protein [Anaerolineae bacterium]
MKPTLFLLAVLFLSLVPAQAQEFGYGVSVSGTLNDATPRVIYTLDGLRGDVIAIDLRVNSGNLDPMLTVIGSDGTVLALSDDATLEGRNNRDLHLESLHIPRNDRYSLVVARFGYLLGTTSGSYTLEVDRIGVSSASGSALRYGDSVYNTITDASPQVYYTFRAARGDTISVRMQRASGDLDPALLLVNSQAQIIADTDDSPGSLDAAINGFVIREPGIYAIIASRFGQAAGRSKGSFVLTLNSGAESGLGRNIDLALPLLPGIPAQGEITDSRDVQFYQFDGKKDDVITIRMIRPSGELDSFLALLDPSRREIVSDDDSGGGQNALINQYVLPVDGTYTVVATRFERAQGTTVGPYQLQLDVSGNAFQNIPEDVPRIEIGDTVQGTITDTVPEMIYAFVARQGDVLTLMMDRASGNLDARMVVLASDQRPLSSDDDSGEGQNARIDFTAPTTGIYYVVATRYGGTQGDPNTTGDYTLTVMQRSG